MDSLGPSFNSNKRSIVYRLWCFIMDSKQGSEAYCKKCNDIAEKENNTMFHTLITFAPYPGRLKWRSWKILKVIQRLKSKWRLRHFKHVKAEDLLKVVRVGTRATYNPNVFTEVPLSTMDMDGYVSIHGKKILIKYKD